MTIEAAEKNNVVVVVAGGIGRKSLGKCPFQSNTHNFKGANDISAHVIHIFLAPKNFVSEKFFLLHGHQSTTLLDLQSGSDGDMACW